MAGAGSARPGRHPPSLRMVVGVVVAVVVVGQVVALPGTFFTNEEIRNKWLPSGSIDVLTGIDQPLCEAQCTVHPKCNAYAISLFERKCVRYNAKVGKAKPVQYLGYNLYILKKTTDDGYNVYGTNYLKLYLDRKNAFDASKACADEGGTLPSVTSDDMNVYLFNLLQKNLVWRATIGVSDMKTEGQWMYANGQPMSYFNWAWNGFWPRPDHDCAVMTMENGTWRQSICWNHFEFFCQIPMF